MKKIKKILVCVDFSDYSLMTLECAAKLAKKSNRKIIIYNVINMRNLGGLETMGAYYSNSVVLEDYVNDLKKERLAMIKDIIKEHFFNEKQMISIIKSRKERIEFPIASLSGFRIETTRGRAWEGDSTILNPAIIILSQFLP